MIFFKRNKPKERIEQSITINFEYGKTDLSDLFDIENRLDNFLSGKTIGYLDGNEIALDGSDGFLFLYGNDAQLLYDAISPILKEAPFMMNAKVHLRFGNVDDNNAEIADFILK